METQEPRANPFPLSRRQLQAAIILFSGGVLIAALVGIGRHQAHADATLERAVRSSTQEQLIERLRVKPRTAGRSTLLPGSAQPYVNARRALARGHPEEALAHLRNAENGLFADREAIVRGEALLALGQIDDAIQSFEKALQEAVLPTLAEAAVEGLAIAGGHQRRYDLAHRYLDTLLSYRNRSRPNPRFLLTKADVFAQAGDVQAAYDLTARILRHYPSSRQASAARILADQTVKRGAIPETLTEVELTRRAEALVDARRYGEATPILDRLPAETPHIQLLRARILAGTGQHERAAPLLSRLADPAMPDAIAGEALHYLARRLLDTDNNDDAQRLFDRLVREAPRSRRARNAEFYGGWIAHDEGRYADAARRMYRYASRHRQAKDRDEALWFGGWSNYLLKRFDNARKDFQRILSEHPRSNQVPRAYYWLGRIAQHQARPEDAQAAYRKILLITPFNYYAVWATQRLRDMDQSVPPLIPPDTLRSPTNLDSALQVLGPGRPVGVDRAILLFREDRPGEVHRELAQALSQIGRADDQTTVRVAELLNYLGAHALACRTSKGIIGSGRGLYEGNPTAWSAWREAYPRAFRSFVDKAFRVHGVAPETVWSIMRTETHFRTTATSRVGAGGVMQIMPATVKSIRKAADGAAPHAARYQEPESNIWLGSWYLSALLERHNGQLALMAASYNAGPRIVDEWLAGFDGLPLDEFVERIPYRETRRYVRRVLETRAIYHQLYGSAVPKLPPTVQRKVAANAKANF